MADSQGKVQAVHCTILFDRSTILDTDFNNYNTVLNELSPEASAVFESWGLTVKDTEGVKSLKCRSKFPMKVYMDNKEWTGRMGNGTKVKARVSPYTVEKGPYKGKVGSRVLTIDILELVERGPEDTNEVVL